MLKAMIEEEGGDNIGDDTSVGDDYFRIDVSEPWVTHFISHTLVKYKLPTAIQQLEISRLKGSFQHLNEFLMSSFSIERFEINKGGKLIEFHEFKRGI
mmetsp:Transcript_23222/g.20596  ORF Transcript_23222/g.20596 Transcript_23222/m.20596 type:complete len:98 (+) Transcript_23222:103-396(+)